MPDPDLPELVRKAQRGDRAAFERIVRGTARVVYAQIVAAVRDRQKAEDLTQETYIAAWRGIGTIQQPAGFMSWLLTLARNTTLDAIKFEGRQKRSMREAGARKAGTRETGARETGTRDEMQLTRTGKGSPALGESAGDFSDDSLAPPERAELAEATEAALALLEELPLEYRRPLSMRYLAGADYETIRRQLQISDGALRGLLNRGMALLRERMTKTRR